MRKFFGVVACLLAAMLLIAGAAAAYLYRLNPFPAIGWVFEMGPYAKFVIRVAPKGVSVPALRKPGSAMPDRTGSPPNPPSP